MKTLETQRDELKPLYDALKKVDDAQKELEAADEQDKPRQKEKLARLKDTAAYVENAGPVRVRQDALLREALANLYKYETAISEAQAAGSKEQEKQARQNFEEAKTKWQTANAALLTVATKDSVKSLEADGIQTKKIAIDAHLRSLDSDINTIQQQLGSTGAGLANAPNAIIGVAEDKSLIRASEAAAAPAPAAAFGVALGEESADVWTKVAFHVGSTSDTSSTKESNVSGSANLQVGGWWASVKASTSFSKSSKKVESAMSSCSVDGSFSAMVVNIKRPWLHGDLFQDFDIDIPENTKLSPGAAQIKEWVEKGDTGTGANKRTEYGKFPAYPTAFIVAADTILEVSYALTCGN